MLQDKIRIHAERQAWAISDGVALFIMAKSYPEGGEPVMRLARLLFEPIDHTYPPPDATVQLRQEEAQALMDTLWDCGLRPTDGAGTAGAMAATQAHVKDLQGVMYRLLALVERTPGGAA